MASFSRCLILVLLLPATLANPIPSFNDIERAWKEGQSEQQIHAAHSNYHPTPSWLRPRSLSPQPSILDPTTNGISSEETSKTRSNPISILSSLAQHFVPTRPSDRKREPLQKRADTTVITTTTTSRDTSRADNTVEFETALDERSLASAAERRRLRHRRRGSEYTSAENDRGLRERIEDFVIAYLGADAAGGRNRETGGGVGEEEDQAPVLRPRGPVRWRMG